MENYEEPNLAIKQESIILNPWIYASAKLISQELYQHNHLLNKWDHSGIKSP